MCGIVAEISRESNSSFVELASEKQKHRGPDGAGQFSGVYNNYDIKFSHQRLAILDLSEAGNQPMDSASGAVTLIFNGEIYNYKELALRYSLGGMKSDCDSEVVVELIEKIGIERASAEFNGMWSLLAFDRVKGVIYISRDRFGKKPLYFSYVNEGVCFASEARSLLENVNISNSLDLVVTSRYLSQSLSNYDDRSWYESISSFPASCCATIPLDDEKFPQIEPIFYWTLSVKEGEEEFDSVKSIEKLRYLVEDAVKLRTNADVPVGVALSGGLDSSIISSITSKESSRIELFSATSPGDKDDESHYVRLMSKYLATPVSEYTYNETNHDHLFKLLKHCSNHNDGPLLSFSSVLFFKLMEMAKNKNIKVILTGQGADEGFCGYRKFPILHLRNLIQNRSYLDSIIFLKNVLRNGTVLKDLKFAEIKRYIGKDNSSLLGAQISDHYVPVKFNEIVTVEERQRDDITKFSVPSLCHYEDRMSMACSVETRSPFLDYRIVEMGLRMPSAYKMKNAWTKYPLRRAFAHSLPDDITWRKDKKGFVNPQDKWLGVFLKKHVNEYIQDPSSEIYKRGLVSQRVYLSKWDRYLKGDRSVWFREVFSPFALEVWLRGK